MDLILERGGRGRKKTKRSRKRRRREKKGKPFVCLYLSIMNSFPFLLHIYIESRRGRTTTITGIETTTRGRRTKKGKASIYYNISTD